MSVNVASAPTAIHDYTSRLSHYNAYPSHASYSPSSVTSSTASPESPKTASTSPNNPNNMQQLRPLRAPTYIPAVLRPTEAPSRHHPSKSNSSNSLSQVSAWASPITPPSSVDSSFESKDGQRSMEEMLQKRTLRDEGITRIVTDEWTDDGLEDVTGAPTRDHWKPDSSSPSCDAPICAASFTWRRRRHHCRRCGLVFCSEHSLREVPLDQHARFHPDGIKGRSCEPCWSDYVAWKRRRGERGSSSTGSTGSTVSSAGSGSATPMPGISRPGSLPAPSSRAGSSAGPKKIKETVVGSMPRDWNWSTF